MSPMQIWCCEAQERYVIAVVHGGLAIFTSLASRERCGFSVRGTAEGNIQEEKRLVLMNRESAQYPKPIDLPMSVLVDKPPMLSRVVESRKLQLPAFDQQSALYMPKAPIDTSSLLNEAVQRILALR